MVMQVGIPTKEDKETKDQKRLGRVLTVFTESVMHACEHMDSSTQVELALYWLTKSCQIVQKKGQLSLRLENCNMAAARRRQGAGTTDRMKPLPVSRRRKIANEKRRHLFSVN